MAKKKKSLKKNPKTKPTTREFSQTTKKTWRYIIFVILILAAAIVGFQTSLYAMALGVIIGFLITKLVN
ncbi:hypothetical protein CMI38_03080 [Candidatus Pacearchaeota archaeon]|jgi:cobalamin synthase|nr:hypothetical protein [Candidatus Pacearchaeota archaeon]|tara:strand:- start:1025 stop:1231 length:207 start_codon:yes stop_codon:yes gene_type:complete